MSRRAGAPPRHWAAVFDAAGAIVGRARGAGCHEGACGPWDHELYAADRAHVLDALRRPVDPGTRLTRDELHEIATVEVGNAIGRYTFEIDEIVG